MEQKLLIVCRWQNRMWIKSFEKKKNILILEYFFVW